MLAVEDPHCNIRPVFLNQNDAAMSIPKLLTIQKLHPLKIGLDRRRT